MCRNAPQITKQIRHRYIWETLCEYSQSLKMTRMEVALVFDLSSLFLRHLFVYILGFVDNFYKQLQML